MSNHANRPFHGVGGRARHAAGAALLSIIACFAAANCFAATRPPFAKRSHAAKSTFTPAPSGVRFRRSFELANR